MITKFFFNLINKGSQNSGISSYQTLTLSELHVENLSSLFLNKANIFISFLYGYITVSYFYFNFSHSCNLKDNSSLYLNYKNDKIKFEKIKNEPYKSYAVSISEISSIVSCSSSQMNLNSNPSNRYPSTLNHNNLNLNNHNPSNPDNHNPNNPDNHNPDPNHYSNKSKKSSLHCLYTNATSLNTSKLAELALLAESSSPQIIFITETWFKDDSIVNIPNYNIFFKNRSGHGGGIAIYTRIDITCNEIPQLQNTTFEQIWLSISTNNEKTLVGCIYRQPSSDPIIDNEIISNIRYATNLVKNKKYGGLLIAGDFNHPNLFWNQDNYVEVLGPDHCSASKFLDFLNDVSLTQNIHFPTFFQANGICKNTLDYVISDTPERITNISKGPPLGSSIQGHLILTWEYNLSSSNITKKATSLTHNYKKGDYSSLNLHFNSINWSRELQNNNINDCYEIFLDIYTSACNKFIPKRIISSLPKFKKLWMNNELLDLIKLKNRLFYRNLASRWKHLELVHEYKSLRAQVKKLTNKRISEYEMDLASDKRNPKRLFTYINSRQKVKSGINSISINGHITTDHQHIANTLNDQFQSVFVNDQFESDLPSFTNRTTHHINTVDFSTGIIIPLLKALDPNKSHGIDKIHPYVLKHAANSLALPLSIIFTKSFDKNKIPSVWSHANVTPLFKKGSKNNPSNYRPISLTCVPCKIMEKIVKISIMNHLNTHNLIAKQQHGFVDKKICVTNLLECSDFITKSYSDKISVDMILLDFAKAFDKVPHQRLLLKLSNYGIKGKLLLWLKAFLSFRKQRVVLGKTTSDWLDVTSGVIQGSVLGPVLFIIYINDLPDVIQHNTSSIYADDTKILAKLRNSSYDLDANIFQNNIDRVTVWTSIWQMELNFEKCKIIHFGKKNKNAQYTIFDHINNTRIPLESSTQERDLGIQINSNLKSSAQCNHAASKANRMLGLTKRTFHSRNPFLWKKLYTTYIRPQMEFAIPAWNPCLIKDINVLEKVQRRSTKVPHEMKHLNYEARCNYFNLSSLKMRRLRGDLIQKFKFENNIESINWYVKPKSTPPRSSHRSYFIRELVKNCRERSHFFNNRIAN